MASIDLKDIYHVCQLQKSIKDIFTGKVDFTNFSCLPFGLLSTPRNLKKIMKSAYFLQLYNYTKIMLAHKNNPYLFLEAKTTN